MTRQCRQTTASERKGEPKRIRTEVPPLLIPQVTAARPNRGPAHKEPLIQSRVKYTLKLLRNGGIPSSLCCYSGGWRSLRSLRWERADELFMLTRLDLRLEGY